MLASALAVSMGMLVAGAIALGPGGEAVSARRLIVPVASSDAHRRDAFGNYGGLKRRPSSPSIRTPNDLRRYPSIRRRKPPVLKQPYPYKYYQDTKRGNYGCDWLARRAINTNSLNWWSRYRACSRNRSSSKRPSYSPQR